MRRNLWVALAMLLTLAACQQRWVYEAERDRKILATNPPFKVYNVPPQTIYQIDDHRFITLESYNVCAGEVWYNNTKEGVRTRVGRTWVGGFHGQLITDDPTEMNVVIPTVPAGVCGDRGCISYMAYSTDGGRTFKWARYDLAHITSQPIRMSKRYTFIVLKDRLYISLRDSERLDYDAYVMQFPLLPGIDLSKPYPDGVHGGSFGLSRRPGVFSGIGTPSREDHYVCDPSIHDPAVPGK